MPIVTGDSISRKSHTPLSVLFFLNIVTNSFQLIVRNMPPQYFVMISKTGALGLGEFPYPEWHKQEKENILSSVGIKVEYGEPAFEGKFKGTFKTVGDKEHAEIIRLYIEERLGLNKIAEMLGRSSRTALTQLQKHNRAVQRSGFCPMCWRFRGEYESRIAQK